MSLSRRHLLAIGAGLTLAGSGGRRAAAQDAVGLLVYDSQLHAALGQGLSLSTLADNLQSASNAYRVRNGLNALAHHPGLALAARAQAADLGLRRYFEHESPEGYSASERVGLLARSFCGYVGENLCMRQGGDDPADANEFLQQWINSPGHKANLLRRGYTHAGVGVVCFDDRVYAAAVYGRQSAELADPMPLQTTDLTALREAMKSTLPRMDFYQISPVGGDGRSGPWPADEAPPPAPGAWRLRPWMRSNGNHFDVLWGPAFVVQTIL